MEWERIMAKECTVLEMCTINGMSQNIKTAFCLFEGSQHEEKQQGPLII
jgi:hypothetical protein